MASAFQEVSHCNDDFDCVFSRVVEILDLGTGSLGHTIDYLFNLFYQLLGLGVEFLRLYKLLLELITTILLVFKAIGLSKPTCLLSNFVLSTWFVSSGPLRHPHDHLVV
jgi:hypothetical protein